MHKPTLNEIFSSTPTEVMAKYTDASGKITDNKVLCLVLMGAAASATGDHATAKLFRLAGSAIAELEVKLEAAVDSSKQQPADGVSKDSFKLSARASRTIHHCLGLYDETETDCDHFAGEVPPTEDEVETLMMLIATAPISTVPNVPALVELSHRQAQEEAKAAQAESVQVAGQPALPFPDFFGTAGRVDLTEATTGRYNASDAAVEGYDRPSPKQAGRFDHKIEGGRALLNQFLTTVPPGVDPQSARQSLRDFAEFLNKVA